jgi:ketosteroid isomerase-like protein
MTATLERNTTAERAVGEFFDAYRRQDVDGMVERCSENADFHYVPFEVWGKQRVIRGDGKVGTIGKTLWTGLIRAFPDLTNTVTSLSSNADGDVVAEVTIGGTQSMAWANIANRGQSFAEPHLFVLAVDDEGLITSITGYWNAAGISSQLGHFEVD